MSAVRKPTLTEVLVTVIIVVAIIVLGIRLQGGLVSTFFPLFLSAGVVAGLGLYLRQKWDDLQTGIFAGLSRVAIAILILFSIGALVGLWISAGVIPTLVYYGLQLFSPSFFLAAAFLVCVIFSVATGTSFGTISTVGVALMGIGSGLGVPAPITSGAIISGAYFGDKMSPLSDTTNIAAAMAETDLFRHIRSMLYTTTPAALIAFILYWIAGGGASGDMDAARLHAMLQGLEEGWNISVLHLVPVLVMLVMAIRRVPALPLIFLNVILGGLWAMIFQGRSLSQVFVAATTGFKAETGIQAIDNVLTRGGMSAMGTVMMLIIVASALGGLLHSTGVLETLVQGLLARVRSTGSLILSVLASCYAVLILTGNQVLSLILPGAAYLPAFRQRRIDTSVLSRTLEDAGTIAAPLIPWGVAGGFATRMLGVPTTEYFPFVWFVFLVPVFSLILAYTGVGIWKVEEEKPVTVATESA